MKLETFEAPTMRMAIEKTRQNLGNDAIIISTRKNSGGVTLTAARDSASLSQNFTAETGTSKAEKPPLTKPIDNIKDIKQALDYHKLPQNLKSQILHHINHAPKDQTANQTLKEALEKTLILNPILPNGISHNPIAFIGAAGSGKTTAIAKLATSYVLNGITPHVISTDTKRAGGIEQLKAFTQILNIPLFKADTPEELKEALDYNITNAPTIIDTSSCNPFNHRELKALKTLLQTNNIEPILIQAAGGDREEAQEITQIFKNIGTKRLIITKLDTTRRLSAIFTASQNLSLSNLSNSQRIADTLPQLRPETLANLLLAQIKSTSNQTKQPQQKTA